MAIKFCQDLLPSLEDLVISELKCMLCKASMFQPTYHCQRGHSICEGCFQIGDHCEACGASLTNARTHHLERIFDKLTYQCKHSGKGCHKRCHPRKLSQHEQECQSIRMTCPLRFGTKCEFVGNKKQIVFHCQLVHGSFTFVGETFLKQKILHKNFLYKILSSTTESPLFQTFYLYCVKDILFQGLVQVSSDHIRVKIYRISLPSEFDEKFYFIIKLFDFHDMVVANYKGECGVTDGKIVCGVKDTFVQMKLHILEKSKYFTVEFMECP